MAAQSAKLSRCQSLQLFLPKKTPIPTAVFQVLVFHRLFQTLFESLLLYSSRSSVVPIRVANLLFYKHKTTNLPGKLFQFPTLVPIFDVVLLHEHDDKLVIETSAVEPPVVAEGQRGFFRGQMTCVTIQKNHRWAVGRVIKLQIPSFSRPDEIYYDIEIHRWAEKHQNSRKC